MAAGMADQPVVAVAVAAVVAVAAADVAGVAEAAEAQAAEVVEEVASNVTTAVAGTRGPKPLSQALRTLTHRWTTTRRTSPERGPTGCAERLPPSALRIGFGIGIGSWH